MKVKAGQDFGHYRNKVLGLDKKDYRALQKGSVVDITKAQFDKCPNAYIETKDKKDGNIQSI